MSIQYVPNLLSVLRLLLVPVFVCLFKGEHIASAIAVFLLAGATDIADGYIARKFHCSTVLGRILDPLADKLMQLSAFLCLWQSGRIHAWMFLAYCIKELVTLVGALVVFRKAKHVVKSNVFGKLATVIVFAAVCIIALFGSALSQKAVDGICLAVALYFVFSCAMYAAQYLRKMKAASSAAADKTIPPDRKDA